MKGSSEHVFYHGKRWQLNGDAVQAESSVSSEEFGELELMSAGTRRYQCAASATLEVAEESHGVRAAVVRYTSGEKKTFEEHLEMPTEDAARRAVRRIYNSNEHALDGPWLAINEPTLFWALHYHHRPTPVETTLTETFGVRKKRRRVQPVQRLTVDEWSDSEAE